MAAVTGPVLTLLLLVWPGATRRSKMVVRAAAAPLERGVSGAARRLADMAAALRGLGDGAARERRLSLELVQAQTELNRLHDVESENMQLRRALSFQRTTPFLLIPSTVMSRNISGWWNSIRIKPGVRKGIRPDCAVISPDGLVGRTLEAGEFSTEVLLVSDPACRVAARLAHSTVYGLVRGMGSTLSGWPQARMEFINKDVEVRVGDEVLTSGFVGADRFFPPGVHIGYVEAVHRDETGLYQYADIVPRATVGLLDYLFVVGDERIP